MQVRPAHLSDAASIAKIYAPYVRSHTATFEVTPPEATEMRGRMLRVFERDLPYLVAEDAGSLTGYAYAVPYRARPAYSGTIESSIYVDEQHHRKGIARRLMEDLIAEAQRLGKRQMIAVVGDSANTASIALHRNLGFVEVGILKGVGFKFDRYIDTVILQRSLL